MNFNSTKVLLANCVVIGVTMTICSNNWISMWMGLEISILSFIPFMQTESISSEESSIKYFIVQSLASACFMLGVVIMLIGVSMMINSMMLMNMAMLVKMGVAPFHNWVLSIVESMKFMVLLSLISLMKIPPMTILSLCFYNTEMPAIMSMLMGSILCLNQTSLRKIIAYSSIFNMGLVISIIEMNYMWILYMIIYSIIMSSIIIILKTKKINFINQMVMNNFNPMIKMTIWMSMLSLGGLPPLTGFLTKILVIQTLMVKMSWITIMTIIMSSLITMSFYLRLAFTSMFNFNTMKKWEMKYLSMTYTMLWFNIITPMLISIKML